MYPLDINKYKITARFKDRNCRFWSYNPNCEHRALDIAAPKHTPFVAIKNHTIEWEGVNSSGRGIVGVCDNGDKVYYWHNESNLVKKRQRVRKGQVIGTIGDSGKAYGTHIHLAIQLKNGQFVDPELYINQDNDNINHMEFIEVENGWGISHVAKAANYDDWITEYRWNEIAKLNGLESYNEFRLYPGQRVRVKPSAMVQVDLSNSQTQELYKKLQEQIEAEKTNRENEQKRLENEIAKLNEEKNRLQNSLKQAQNIINGESIEKPSEPLKQDENTPRIDLDKISLPDWQKELIVTGITDLKQDPNILKVVNWWKSLPKWFQNFSTVAFASLIGFLIWHLPNNQLPDLEISGYIITGASITSILISFLRFVFDSIKNKYS